MRIQIAAALIAFLLYQRPLLPAQAPFAVIPRLDRGICTSTVPREIPWSNREMTRMGMGQYQGPLV